MGVGDKLPEMKRMYHTVNQMLGDIVKITPTSKVVGDLASYMLTNNLTPEDVMKRGGEIQFPESVIGLFAGDIGYPVGGLPEELQCIILRDRKPVERRLSEHLPPVDFKAVQKEVEQKVEGKVKDTDVLSYLM